MEKIDGINSEILESLYHGNGYTTYEIADLFGYSRATISRRMQEYNISFRGLVGDDIEPELLNSLYLGNGYPIQQIADLFGCSAPTISKKMKEYGIVPRGITDFSFNDRQKEIFEGCMLGDGSLSWHTNYCSFRNFDIHRSYLVWLQKHLGVKHISKILPIPDSDDITIGYLLATRAIPSIRSEYPRWKPNGIGTLKNRRYKVVPSGINLSLTNVLFWYIGDGTYHKRDGDARFVNSFSLENANILADKLKILLDVDTGVTTYKGNKDSKGNQRYSIRLSRLVTSKFFDMVDSLDFDIPDCYLYKFGKEKLCQNEN